MFDPFANKMEFKAFTVESSSPCPKCGCRRVLIAPTNNTHAASARCPGPNAAARDDKGCGRFFRWLGKRELESLTLQTRASKLAAAEAASKGDLDRAVNGREHSPLDNEHPQGARNQ